MKKALWSLLEILETIVIAVGAVILIRAFIVQPFLVSGSSMEPSFESGNYLLIDELVYRFRTPERGEVIVFKNPTGGGSYYIKRIIGLPGEKVVVNGNRVEVQTEEGSQVLEEWYVNRVQGSGHSEVTLKEDEYFMMGDNRGFSFDSRNWGPLEEDNIIGLVRLRLWPINEAMAIVAPIY